jgi:hypothetical protein
MTNSLLNSFVRDLPNTPKVPAASDDIMKVINGVPCNNSQRLTVPINESP